MRRRRYDFVFGLGPACSCSQSLRAAGLQLTSLPFDWNGLQLVPDRQRLLETDFKDWLRREDFEPTGEDVLGRKNVWYNRRTRCTFAHDFQEAVTDEQIRLVAEKYRRRIDRMYRLIADSRRVLAVWVQVKGHPPRPSEPELRAFRQSLMKKWPGVSFDILLFDWAPGVAEADARDATEDGLRCVAFDYRDRSQDRWFADYDLLGRWLKRRYAVRDYRTKDEKRQWCRQVREKKFARFGVRTWLGYFCARSAYALRKHFSKGRKG